MWDQEVLDSIAHYTPPVIESYRVVYFEEDIDTSQGPREIVFREERVIILIPVAFAPLHDPMIDQNPEITHDDLVD